MSRPQNKFSVTVSVQVETAETEFGPSELAFSFSESTDGVASMGTDSYGGFPSELASLYLAAIVAVRAAVEGLAECHAIVEGHSLIKVPGVPKQPL